MEDTSRHNDLVRDQFTKQAAPFAQKMAAPDRMHFPVLRELTEVSSEDTVLDVACGPGLIACAFAEVACAATGLDMTPAMLDRARHLQEERGLANIAWELGDVYHLPYCEGAFSLVVTRYSFHHLVEPLAALREMVRVCSPGGRVCVIDMVASRTSSDAFNAAERLRDPSHVRAMAAEDLNSLLAQAGLAGLKTASWRIEWEVEEQLKASATKPDAAEQFRVALRSDVDRDVLGVGAHLIGQEVHYSYLNLAVAGWKP
jgi:SAM-dependent methyltransferase